MKTLRCMALALALSACGPPCDEAIEKMDECFAGNVVPIQSNERCTEAEICAAECVIENSCSEIGAYISRSPNKEPGAGEVFAACYDPCGL